MKRRRLFLVLLLLLLLGSLLLVPTVRWPIYGWLRGEAFYRGMPTSWWAEEIKESYSPVFGCLVDVAADSPMDVTWVVPTPPSLWDQLWQRVSSNGTVNSASGVIVRGSLLDGNAAALPLLLVLVRHDSAKVRRVAVYGLVAQGRQSPEVVPALLMAVKDQDECVALDALRALTALDPEAADRAGKDRLAKSR